MTRDSRPDFDVRLARPELAHRCIERARELGRAALVLHTTRAMQTAWGI